MADGEKPKRPRAPRKAPAKAAARKVPARRAPAKRAPSQADREKAAAQIASVTPIRKPQRGRGGNNPKNSPTSPQNLLVYERRVQVLNLRRLGLQYEQIVEQIRADARFGKAASGYCRADVSNDLRAITDSVTVEAVQGIREEDLALLLSMQRSVYPAALNGDVASVKAMLSILERRAKYLGLDAPIRHQLTGADGGPIQVDTTDDGAVYAAALAALDDTLPHLEPIALPGMSGTE